MIDICCVHVVVYLTLPIHYCFRTEDILQLNEYYLVLGCNAATTFQFLYVVHKLCRLINCYIWQILVNISYSDILIKIPFQNLAQSEA